MKLCIFSDVHGNIAALDSMIESEKKYVDQFYFLGDIFGYFPHVNAVIDKLCDLQNIKAVRGNHDQYFLKSQIDCREKLKRIQIYGWSYGVLLSEKQLQFINGLPNYIECSIDGVRLCFIHGGPNDFLEERIYSNTSIVSSSFFSDFDYVFLGHTHYRMLRKTARAMIVNPGSLGQPRDGHGFSYCLFDTVNKVIEYKTVEIDEKNLVDEVEMLEGNSSNYSYLAHKYGRI